MSAIHLLGIANPASDMGWLDQLVAAEPLSGQVRVSWSYRLEEGLRRLSEQPFEAVLLELDLPDSRGLDTLRRVQKMHPTLPVIVLAGENEEDYALHAVQAGAQDYLSKEQASPRLFVRTIIPAIERKRYELDLERQAREMQALYETSLEINAQVSLPALLASLVDRAAQLLNVPVGALYMLQPDEQTLRLDYGVNLEHDYRGVTLLLGEGLSGRAAQTGETIAIEDYQQWDGRAAVFENSSFRRVLAVPLKSGGKVIGVINLSDDQHVGPWTEEELRLANLFADQAAIAVQNARLLEAERQKSAELARSNAVIAALSQVASRLGETLRSEQIIEAIGSDLRRLGITVQFVLFDQNPKTLAIRYVSVDPETVMLVEAMLGRKIIGFPFPEQAWNGENPPFSRKPDFVLDAHSLVAAALPDLQPSVVEFVLTRLGLNRRMPLIFLPLMAGDEPFGWMMAWGSDLRASDLPAFIVFSNQVAVNLENARLYNHIEWLATTDELTQLYNRRGFFLLGEQQMRVSQRAGSPLLLIFIDVDQLKHINDHYGHKEGDRALVAAAEALRATFRSADIVARISGDEFAVLVSPPPGIGAGRLLERLHHEIEQINARGDRPFVLSVSAGFAVWTADQAESIDDLLARADAQMYQDKRRKTGSLR